MAKLSGNKPRDVLPASRGFVVFPHTNLRRQMHDITLLRVCAVAAAFFASLAMDWLFAHWTRAVVEGRRGRATGLSGAYYALSTLVVVLLVADWLAGVAGVIGHMAGTWIAVRSGTRTASSS